jgi:hypothetical protein
MAIEDVDGVFLETGALERCLHHPEILIRVHDEEKEQRAYAIAKAQLRNFPTDEQQAAMDSMRRSLESAADRHCPLCAAGSLRVTNP